jgi:hypothetical protein
VIDAPHKLDQPSVGYGLNMAGKDGFVPKKLSSSGGKKAAQILPKDRMQLLTRSV